MPKISATFEVPMGHRLMHHEGKCKFIHGHNYVFEIVATSPSLNPQGMVMDFKDLKLIVKEILDPLDHAMMLCKEDPLAPMLTEAKQKVVTIEDHPTAEVIAAYVTSLLNSRALHWPNGPITFSVVVWETRDCSASW